MNKKIYFVLAVIISLILTAAQNLIIYQRNNSHMKTICIAAKDIEMDTIIREDCISLVKVSADDMVNVVDYKVIIGSVAVSSIKKGDIIATNDFNQLTDISPFRYMSMKINGDNFNANNIEKYDYVDIYFIPDWHKFEKYQIDWIIERLEDRGIDFIMEKDVGFMITDIQIAYIDEINQSAQHVSLKMVSPVDEIISLLKTNSVYQFIRLNNQ